jgi:hypothetical protein
VRTLAAYHALDEVYKSNRSREAKLAAKAKIIDELVADLRIRKRPTNASLTEAKVYNGGASALLSAHRACGDLRSLVEAAKTLRRSDFPNKLQNDLAPIATLLAERCQAAQKTGHVAPGPSR